MKAFKVKTFQSDNEQIAKKNLENSTVASKPNKIFFPTKKFKYTADEDKNTNDIMQKETTQNLHNIDLRFFDNPHFLQKLHVVKTGQIKDKNFNLLYEQLCSYDTAEVLEDIPLDKILERMEGLNSLITQDKKSDHKILFFVAEPLTFQDMAKLALNDTVSLGCYFLTSENMYIKLSLNMNYIYFSSDVIDSDDISLSVTEGTSLATKGFYNDIAQTTFERGSVVTLEVNKEYFNNYSLYLLSGKAVAAFKIFS